jgi:hypothetical protein
MSLCIEVKFRRVLEEREVMTLAPIGGSSVLRPWQKGKDGHGVRFVSRTPCGSLFPGRFATAGSRGNYDFNAASALA